MDDNSSVRGIMKRSVKNYTLMVAQDNSLLIYNSFL